MNATGSVLVDTSVVVAHFRGDSGLYGQIKAELAQAGTPIPDNDIWIAALTREYQLPLVTRDQHFNLVSGMQTLDW